MGICCNQGMNKSCVRNYRDTTTSRRAPLDKKNNIEAPNHITLGGTSGLAMRAYQS